MLGVLGEIRVDESDALLDVQGLELKHGPTTLGQVVQRPAGQCGHDQAHVLGDARRQPHQVRRAVAVLQLLQLVQRVEHQDHPASGRGHAKAFREGQAKGLGLDRDLLLDAEPGRQLAHDPVQHDPAVGAVAVGADEMDDRVSAGMGFAVSDEPVRQQRTLARARLAQHHQRRPIPGSMCIQPVEVLLPADVHAHAAAREGLVFCRLAG